MRTRGAATRHFMRHVFNKCDYGAGRVVILIPALVLVRILLNFMISTFF